MEVNCVQCGRLLADVQVAIDTWNQNKVNYVMDKEPYLICARCQQSRLTYLVVLQEYVKTGRQN